MHPLKIYLIKNSVVIIYKKNDHVLNKIEEKC